MAKASRAAANFKPARLAYRGIAAAATLRTESGEIFSAGTQAWLAVDQNVTAGDRGLRLRSARR